ncbi:MAG TPA: anthranilate phosphoribosyltransferase [Turneriella sp.]|nr:anthranilate phosphoribosyltransferase [Turneriella sp.]
MIFYSILEELLAKQDLPNDKITHLISETMQGQLNEVQIAAWLIAMRMKGETPSEIAACAQVMRRMATPIRRGDLPSLFLDTCGTGGDRSHLINISTLVALTLAAQGIPVAKHGNRAVSSASGSADVLEGLGYPLDENPDFIAKRLTQQKFAFFFAPHYHPAMKYAGPVRRSLGVRTIFNILGPLSNPASAPIQLMGVYAPELLIPLAETLKLLGLKAAMVFHSEDGLDEISPIECTHYALLYGDKITTGIYKPPQQNYLTNLDTIRSSTKEKSLQIFKDTIAGRNAAAAYMVSLNAIFGKKLFDMVSKGAHIVDLTPTADDIVEIFDFIQSGALSDIVQF